MFNWLLSLFGGGTSPSALARRTRSPDPEVRRQAAHLLATASDPRANGPLVFLLQDGDSAVRAAARHALQQRGGEALQPLLHALGHADANVAQTAAELLGELGRPEAVEPLLAALKFGMRPVQLAARRALQALGPLAVTALTAAQDESQPWVRRQIEEILQKGPEPREAVEKDSAG